MGANHYFDSDIADMYGTTKALLIQNICYWIEHNQKNKINFRDGKYWTYNSLSAFQKTFRYIAPRAIRSALEELRADGVLFTANYSKHKPKLLWYSVCDEIFKIFLEGRNRKKVVCQNTQIEEYEEFINDNEMFFEMDNEEKTEILAEKPAKNTQKAEKTEKKTSESDDDEIVRHLDDCHLSNLTHENAKVESHVSSVTDACVNPDIRYNTLINKNLKTTTTNQNSNQIEKDVVVKFLHELNPLFVFSDRFVSNLCEYLQVYNLKLDFVKFIFDYCQSKNPKNLAGYFYSVIFENSLHASYQIHKEQETKALELKERMIAPCPVCGTIDDRLSYCPHCRLEKNKREDKEFVLEHKKYFFMSDDEKQKYDLEVNNLFSNFFKKTNPEVSEINVEF